MLGTIAARRLVRRVAVVTALVLAVWSASAAAQNRCTAAKTRFAGKAAAAMLRCDAAAAQRGAPADVTCMQRAEHKFAAGSLHVDGRQSLANPSTICPNGGGDVVAASNVVDLHVGDVAAALDPAAPAFVRSSCTAQKLKCVAKKETALAACRAKALQTGAAVSPTCAAPLQARFAACFARAEAHESPAKPDGSNVCVAADGNAAEVEQRIDDFVAHVATFYAGPANGCPTHMTFTPAAGGAGIDLGWSGFGHDAAFVGDAAVTVGTTCPGTPPSCGVCTYSGPVENPPGTLQAHRCSSDSSLRCASTADCPAGDTCDVFFGSYMPLPFGGLVLCLANRWNGPIDGTVDLEHGTAAGTARLRTSIYSGYIDPMVTIPCPKCEGDTVANDGLRGGTCMQGSHAGSSCDVNGPTSNASFGATSLDCPPDASTFLSTETLDLSHTTGTKTAALTAASPSCRAIGFTDRKCHCDVCDDPAASLCSSDAECIALGGTRCGGARCIGGGNAGVPCVAVSECPGGGCGVPGPRTQPNACDGGADDCVAGDNPPGSGPNERVCASGPFEQNCAPFETFRGCLGNADCPHPGDTCSAGRFRECFDTGTIGDTVVASGQPDLRVAHHAHPTLAALFCANATHNAFADAMGLPGLGRLELRGDVVDDGVP